MSHTPNQSIAAALQEKLNEVLVRRARNERLKAALASEDLAIDRDLADLRAAVRVLGAPFEIPETEKRDAPRLVLRTDNLWRTLFAHTKEDDAPQLPLDRDTSENDLNSAQDTAVSARPPIKDIVLARLKEAGDEGTGATAIRKYIEQVYGEIHKKTVGMTLYRLSKDGLVRREGNTWFLAQPSAAEKGNPGGETPGSIDDLLK